jgi:hypothetical protein
MLQNVLQAIEATNGPVHLGLLSRQLGLDQQVLAGMVEFWVRKGRITTNLPAGTACALPAGQCPTACGCGGPAGCPIQNDSLG